MTPNCQALFYENIKCAWERADSKNTSLPGTFYGHFESAWESADEKKAGAEAGVGWQIWLKCHYLRILSHLGEMS